MEIIGHRGASHTAPENTLASVKRAWQLGADAVEVDVHLTADQRVVVIHDSNTKRTTGVDLAVRETASDKLRELDAGSHKGSEFAGEKIPFLEEVIETVPPARRLFVEVKCSDDILPILNDIIAGSGKRTQIVIISFSLDTVSRAKTLMPDIEVCWLKGGKQDADTGQWLPYGTDIIETAREHGLDGLDLHSGGITRSLAHAVKEAGLKLYAWTVNDPAEAARLDALGVDGLTTDRPGWMQETLSARSQ